MDKQAILRAKRAQYMNSRLADELLQQETHQSQPLITPPGRANSSTSVVASPPRPGLPPIATAVSSSSSGHNNSRHQPTIAAAEDVLQKITQKLTNHIREELMREQLNSNLQQPEMCNTLLSRIDDFVSSELTSFTCTICYELMRPPAHLPILLFPCGHTFCETCINQHIAACASKMKSTVKTCPYCRTNIESKAINHALKGLIDSFVAQKMKLENRQATADDIFVSKNGANKKPTTAIGRPRPSSSEETTLQAQSYSSQLRSCEMRLRILQSELEDSIQEKESVSKRKIKLSQATEHLENERVKVNEKIQLLMEEKNLIEEHLNKQDKKLQEVKREETAAIEKVQLLSTTLKSVQAEIEKLKLLDLATSTKRETT